MTSIQSTVDKEERDGEEEPKKWLWKKFDSLVLSGMGIRSVSVLGALHYCEINKLLDVKSYYGTSSGAIICYLLLIGYTSIEIISYICTHKLLNQFAKYDFSRLMSNQGCFDFSYIEAELERLSLRKIGCVLTMKQLHNQFNKQLTIVTYNDSERERVNITHKSHPSLSIITALRMSCNIPLLFEDFKYMGSYYADGVFANNFPTDLPDPEKYTLGIDIEQSLTRICGDINIYQKVINIISLCISNTTTLGNDTNPNIKILRIRDENTQLFKPMTTPEILDLFSTGYNYAEDGLPLSKK